MAYPGVILRLELTRQLTYYSLQLFIPRLMIVMLLLLMTRMLIYLQLSTPSGLFVTLAWATMFFPTNVAGIRAQYNVQITNLIST